MKSEGPIFIKSDTKVTHKKVIKDFESYRYKPRDIKAKKLSPAEKQSMREEHLLSLKELGRIEFLNKAIDKFTDNKSTIEEALNSIKALNVDYINPNEEEIYIILNAFKHLEILDFFIKSGLNVKDEKFNLIISVCNKIKARPEVLNRLIERGANLDVKDKDGNTPLHHACKNGNIKLAKVLIENQVNLTSENKGL